MRLGSGYARYLLSRSSRQGHILKAPRTRNCTSNRLFFQESRVDRMGRTGRGARVGPTDESRTAPLSYSAAVFTPVVPDHVADDPESREFRPALVDARWHTDGQGYVSRPRDSLSVPWVVHRRTYACVGCYVSLVNCCHSDQKQGRRVRTMCAERSK